MVDVALVPVEQVKTVWPLVSGWLHEAIRRGDLGKFSEIEREVLGGGALLWVVHNGIIASAVITQTAIFESGKVCTIVACGGEGVLGDLRLLGRIEEYARQEGCRSIRVMGRKGWARALKDYRTAAVVLEKDL